MVAGWIFNSVQGEKYWRARKAYERSLENALEKEKRAEVRWNSVPRPCHIPVRYEVQEGVSQVNVVGVWENGFKATVRGWKKEDEDADFCRREAEELAEILSREVI